MANQCKFVLPELHQPVLEHLSIEEQFNLRRVNKDFKHVIEVQIWPFKKELDIADIDLACSSSKNVWNLMLSHMPKLNSVIVDPLDNCSPSIPRICSLLAKYCQGIMYFGGHRGYGNAWALEYMKQLSILGVHNNYIVIGIDDDKSWKLLDEISPESEFMLHINYGRMIPNKYLDRICGFHDRFLPEKPYLPNLIEVGDITHLGSEDELDDFVSQYHSQISVIGRCNSKLADKLFQFSNLREISIITTMERSSYYQELEYVKTLKRFLESDASCHLNSLTVTLRHPGNAQWLIDELSFLDLRIGWDNLEVAYQSERLRISRDSFEAHLMLLTDPKAQITDWFDRIHPPREIILTFDDSDTKMNKLEFDDWKQWIEIYASEHRNMQIDVEMWTSIRGGDDVKIEDANWFIVHSENLYEDI